MAAGPPVVEAIFIDEVFLDLNELRHLVGFPETIGQQIKATIRTAARIALAPVGGQNRLGFRQAGRVVVVPAAQVLDFLGGQPVGVLGGVDGTSCCACRLSINCGKLGSWGLGQHPQRGIPAPREAA